MVFCDCQYFPGEILEVQADELKLFIMIHSLGTTFKWPTHRYIDISTGDVRKRVSPHVPAGNRGQFAFRDL
jgi:hypothetical protein